MRPQFVTFTGLDEKTDLDRVRDLSSRYPIEWGLLIGGKIGNNRYPDIMRFLEIDVSLSLHLCGTFAQSALHSESHGWRMDDKAVLLGQVSAFKRVQVNAGKYDTNALLRFQKEIDKPVIMQTRGKAFLPPLEGISCLFDTSGGKGRYPSFWPVQPALAPLVGYAGGIGPGNVTDVLAAIDAHTFWLDMESRIRDNDDWLDLDSCEAVCQRIWD